MSWRYSLFVALCLVPTAALATPLTRDTLRPLLIADVNALQANHYFVQSMLDFNSTPFTIGYGSQQASVEFERIDGKKVSGALSKDQLVLSLGFGRPKTSWAGYAVLNFAGATAGNFPKPPLTNQNTLHIRATDASIFAAFGVAYKGWVAQVGWHYDELRVHSDQYGRLTTCGDVGYCTDQGYPSRAGAPEPIVISNNKKAAGSRMFTLENEQGYSLGALLAELESLRDDGTSEVSSTLAGLRLLAQPEGFTEQYGATYGIGLNTYAKQLDYYGDRGAATERAVREGRPVPQGKAIAEIPLVADNIMGLGFQARVVEEVYPTLKPRLAEVGYIYAGEASWDFVPNGGARAKVFRRGNNIEGAFDAYAGFFWVTSRSTTESEGRGLSLFATYSYNSPDASNFIPLPGAHVVGAQLVWGNPAALAPPVPTVKVPASAQYQGEDS